MDRPVRPERVLIVIAAIVIVIGGMKAASGVLVPALLALFIAIVCTEPMYWMVRKGIPRWLSIIIVVVILLGISSTFPLVISGSYIQFTQELPTYQERFEKLLVEGSAFLEEWGYDGEMLVSVLDPSAALGYIQVVLTALGGILSRFFLIMLLVIFILVDVPQTLKGSASGEIIRTVQHYFAIKTFTSFLTGAAVAIFLIIMDVQYPLLWGFVAFLFNFVPNIGSVIAAIPALILSLLFEGYGTALGVMIGYVIINVGISNGIEPRIMGQQLGLRFVWIFVSLIFWGWTLGPVGMLLAVPLTMTLRIITESHPDTRWIAAILVPEKMQMLDEQPSHESAEPSAQ